MKNSIFLLFLFLIACTNTSETKSIKYTEWSVLKEYEIVDNNHTIPKDSNLQKTLNHQVIFKGYCRKIAPDFSKYYFTEDNFSEWELDNTSVFFDAKNFEPLLDSLYEVSGILTIQEFSDGKLTYEIKNAKIKKST